MHTTSFDGLHPRHHASRVEEPASHTTGHHLQRSPAIQRQTGDFWERAKHSAFSGASLPPYLKRLASRLAGVLTLASEGAEQRWTRLVSCAICDPLSGNLDVHLDICPLPHFSGRGGVFARRQHAILELY